MQVHRIFAAAMPLALLITACSKTGYVGQCSSISNDAATLKAISKFDRHENRELRPNYALAYLIRQFSKYNPVGYGYGLTPFSGRHPTDERRFFCNHVRRRIIARLRQQLDGKNLEVESGAIGPFGNLALRVGWKVDQPITWYTVAMKRELMRSYDHCLATGDDSKPLS